MLPRRADKIDRCRLSTAYIENMTRYLVSSRGITSSEARAFVTNRVKETAKIPRMKVIETIRPGRVEEKVYDLTTFSNIIRDKVLTPSGSVYKSVTESRSIVAILISEFMANRKKVKGKMFKAQDSGDKEKARMYQALQNSIKVVLNSLPGSFGYPSSIFYDKGSYNAVTSSARMLISNSFTCCEQFLGGNIPIFDEEEAINLIILIRNSISDTSEITKVMQKHNLEWVGKEQVMEYFNNSLKKYSITGDLRNNVDFVKILDSLSQEHVQFVWYHSNMQHICFGNDAYIRPLIKKAFNISKLNTGGIDGSKDNFFSLNSDIMAIATTVMAKEVGGRAMSEIPNDLVLSRRVIACYTNVNEFLEGISDIFNLFIYHNINFQKILSRNQIQRESVVVSDTDSVIFTAMAWSTWFTKQKDEVTYNSYCISALATYWLIEANGDTMAKFAIALGAVGDDIGKIQMKNEYTYPAMLLYDIKKVYAALMAAQEGVVFKELVPDLKGAAIRGVAASIRAKEFAVEVLVEDVLKPVIKGNVSARDLIDKVVSFEKKIRRALSQGGLDFLPIVSVKTREMYAKPNSSAHFHAMAWNEIFGEKYEYVQPPNKLPLLKIVPPTEPYFDMLKETSPDIYDKFKAFIEKHGKSPSAFFIPPTTKKLPKELRPIMDTRSIVYFNVSPIYLTLASLNIGIGSSKQHLLLSDIYKGE